MFLHRRGWQASPADYSVGQNCARGRALMRADNQSPTEPIFGGYQLAAVRHKLPLERKRRLGLLLLAGLKCLTLRLVNFPAGSTSPERLLGGRECAGFDHT
jgi:hypothetical protein